MTADVQRELAELLRQRLRGHVRVEHLEQAVLYTAEALLPSVQALIADAEKRAAARALRRMAQWTVDTGYADAAVLREFRDRAAALGPSGAAEGAGR